MSQAAITPIQAPDTIAVNLAAFLRSLRAEHKSERTIETYRESVVQLATFLAAGTPDDIRNLRREHIEAWIIALLGRRKPATVNNRYRGLQAFFRWCLDEDIIGTSPMAKMKPPKVPEQPVPVLRLEAIAKLIATAERTKRFEDIRDAAILRIFYSTGVRLAELATLRYLPADPEATATSAPMAYGASRPTCAPGRPARRGASHPRAGETSAMARPRGLRALVSWTPRGWERGGSRRRGPACL